MSRPISADVIRSGTHGWSASRHSNIEGLVRAARRHSRLVRFVRVALPIGVVLGLTALLLVTYLDPLRMLEKLPSVSGKLAISGSKITMQAPRIAGFTRDSRTYELTAETAVQDIASPDVVELKEVRAKMELQDQNMVQISAASGVYNTKSEHIVLRDQVTVISPGYRGRLREAAIDMKQAKVVSEQPVEVTTSDSVITANRLEILEGGELIRFDRGVVMTIDGEKPPVEGTTR